MSVRAIIGSPSCPACARQPMQMLKRSPDSPFEGEEDGGLDVEDDTPDKNRRPRIRCPNCNWEPPREARWVCVCGHVWNTFDTGGRCPGCDMQWRDTACLACSEWSPHLDWYVEEEDGPEES